MKKYGLKMDGLKDAAMETKLNAHCGLWTEIAYNKASGKIYTTEFADGNTYSNWRSDDIVNIVTTNSSLTQEQIAELIYDEVC